MTDEVGLDKLLDCSGPFITINRQDYCSKEPWEKSATRSAAKMAQTDATLIAGHFKNTLKVNGRQLESKVWPTSMNRAEEYRDYLKRLECCKKDVYDKHFRCPGVNICTVECMLKNLDKTEYQRVYSPGAFLSKKTTKRDICNETLTDPTHMKYEETVYGVSYNRIQEMNTHFRNLLPKKLPTWDDEDYKNELRKLYRTGITTYYQDLCIPAMEMTKKKEVLQGPIDRYTLRRW